MNKTVGKWLILIALLAYVGFATAWARSRAESRRCSGLEVIIDRGTSADTLTRRGVIKELLNSRKKFMGLPASRVDVNGIEYYLSRFSNFEEVECMMTSSGKLRIRVRPMVPELRVFDGTQSYYINKDGKRIDANADFFVDVPVVSGHFSRRFPAASLLPVTRHIAADSVLSQLFSMVYADSPDNIILIPRLAGHVVNIGDSHNLPEKFHNLMLMYRKVMPYKGWETYDSISVKFKGQIVATRRDKTPAFLPPAIEEETDLEESTLPEDDSPQAATTTKKPDKKPV